MTPAAIFGIAVFTLLVLMSLAGRLSSRQPGLGSVSQTWLAEERASASDFNRT